MPLNLLIINTYCIVIEKKLKLNKLPFLFSLFRQIIYDLMSSCVRNILGSNKLYSFEKEHPVFCSPNRVTPLNSWDIAIAHLALFSRPACATPDSFVPFCSTESNCFMLAVCEREGMKRTKNGRGVGLGTEIINARLPATPHYLVRALLPFDAIASRMLVR